MKVKIKHIDGKTIVTATVYKTGNEYNLEYRFQRMTYGITMSKEDFEKAFPPRSNPLINCIPTDKK